jgi:DNA-binding NarL/FixJ family response regulator
VLGVALAQSSPEEAAFLVEQELELARATGLARPTGIALRAAGTLASGAKQLALLRESVELLETSEAKLEHARSLVALGSALRRGQLRADARSPLREGLELAVACGATRLADRAGEELRAAGSRPPRDLVSRRDVLTASELRVARLAAEGATNPEIAQELYVSLKTIETHLSHAYGKLGLSGRGSRERLADALEDDALDAAGS